MAVATSNTAYGIIADGMVDAGLLSEGQLPNSDQLSSGLRRLCDIINFIQTQAVKVFLDQEITVTMVAGTAEYTINPTAGLVPTKHLSVLQGYVQQINSKRVLVVASHNEYMNLPTTDDGTVTQYYTKKLATSLSVVLWPAPDSTDAANTLVFLVRTQAPNPINLQENVTFPQEWRLPLRWLFADDICTGQPAEIMRRCSDKAEYYRDIIEGWDVEDADVTFAADISQAYPARSFR